MAGTSASLAGSDVLRLLAVLFVVVGSSARAPSGSSTSFLLNLDSDEGRFVLWDGAIFLLQGNLSFAAKRYRTHLLSLSGSLDRLWYGTAAILVVLIDPVRIFHVPSMVWDLPRYMPTRERYSHLLCVPLPDWRVSSIRVLVPGIRVA